MGQWAGRVSAVGQALLAGQASAEGQALLAQESQEEGKASLQAAWWWGTAGSRTDNQQTLPSDHLRKCSRCILECPSTGSFGVRPCQRRNPSRGSCMQSTPGLGWAPAASEPVLSAPELWEPVWESWEVEWARARAWS